MAPESGPEPVAGDQTSVPSSNCIKRSFPPTHAGGAASAMSSGGYHFGPRAGSLLHIAIAPAVLATTPTLLTQAHASWADQAQAAQRCTHPQRHKSSGTWSRARKARPLSALCQSGKSRLHASARQCRPREQCLRRRPRRRRRYSSKYFCSRLAFPLGKKPHDTAMSLT